MPTFSAGSVEATLELDRAPFSTSLSIARSMAAQFEANDVTATLKANLNPLMGALRSARASLNSFSRERAEAALGVDSVGANAAIEGVTQNLQQFGREREEATMDANTRPARRAMDGFDEVFRRYGRSWGQQGIRARVQADIRRAQAQLRLLERTVEGITDEDHRIRVQADILRTRQRLEGLGRLATSLGLRSPTISVGLRGHLATAAQMVGLQRIADRLDGYNIRFGANIDDSLSRALPNLLGALEMQVARWKTIMTATAAVTMPIFYSSLAALPAVLSAGAGAVASLASAIGQGLAGAVGIAATALTQGLVGALATAGGALGLGGVALGGYYAAVNRTVSYLGDLTSTLRTAREDVKSASKAVEEARVRMNRAEKGTREYGNATRGLALAQEESRYRQRRLNALYDIATPKVQRLQRRVNDARLGLLRFGGAIMDLVAPAIITGIDTFDRFSGEVSKGALEMVSDMDKVAQGFIRATAKGQNLRSITTILQGIKSAGVPAMELVGNAALFAVNMLAPLVGHSLKVLNNLRDLVAEASRWSQTEAGQRRIAEVWALLARQGRRLVRVATNVGGILLDVFAPATPYAEDFLKALVGITNRTREWTDSAEGQEKIAGTWAKLARRGRWLWKVSTDLGAALWGVMVALEDSGTVDFMARAVSRLTGRMRDGLSATGTWREEIEKFMRKARPVMRAVGSLAKEAVKQFLRLADEVINFRAEGEKLTVLEDIAYSIRDSLEEVTDFLLYEFKNIGPLIGPLIEELTDWFSTMAKSQPEMKAFIRLLTKTLEFFNGLPEDTQRNIARIIAYIAAFKSLGGGAATGAVANLAASVVQWRLLRNIWKGMPPQPVVTPPISPAGPMPVGRRAGPGIPPPVVPAPVPARGSVRSFLSRLGQMGWVAAIGGFFAGVWRKIPFSAQLGRVFSRIRIGPILKGLVGFGARLIGGLVRFFMGPAGWVLLAISLYDSLIKDFDEWLTKGLGEAFNIDLVGILENGPTKWGEDFGKWCRKQLGKAWKAIKDWWNSPDRWTSLGTAIVTGVIKGFLQHPIIGPLIKGFAEAWNRVREWWGVKSPSTRAVRLGRDIMRGIVEGVKNVPLIGPMIQKAQALYRGARKAFQQGGWRGLGAWVVRQIVAGLKQVPILGPLVQKAQSLYRGARQAFRRNGWRGLGVWVVRQIVAGLKQIPVVGPIVTKAQQLFQGARRAFRRGGWKGLGLWVVNQILDGLKQVPIVGPFVTKIQRFFQGARKAFRRGGWRGLGKYVVDQISGGLKNTKFFQFASKVATFFQGARRAYRRHGWKGLGNYVVEQINNGLKGTKFYNFASKVATFFSGARAAYRRQGWKGLGQYVVNTINSGLRGTPLAGLIEKLQNMYNSASNYIRDSKWFNLGVAVVQGLINGVQSGDFGNFLVNMAKSAYRRVRDFFRSKSPSRLFAELGVTLPQGLAAGIQSQAGRAVSAAEDMAGRVSRAASVDAGVRLRVRADRQRRPLREPAVRPKVGYTPARPSPFSGRVSPSSGRNPTTSARAEGSAESEVVRLAEVFRSEITRLVSENRRIADHQAREAVKIALAALASDAGRYLQDQNLLKMGNSEGASMARAR